MEQFGCDHRRRRGCRQFRWHKRDFDTVAVLHYSFDPFAPSRRQWAVSLRKAAQGFR